MEDTRKEDDLSSDDLASVEEKDPLDLIDSPNGGAKAEDEDDAQDDTDVIDEDEDLDDEAKQTIPYDRFKQKIDENKALKAEVERLKTPVATKPEEKKLLKTYTPEQIAAAKDIVSEAMKDELGEIAAIKKTLEEQAAEKKQQHLEAFQEKDTAQLREALKTYGNGVTEEQARKQIEKWEASKDPELQALARGKWKYVLLEMQEMKDARSAKKPKSAPKIDANGDDTLRKPEEKDTSKLSPIDFRDAFVNGALSRVQSSE